jgi:hypothetical protein
MSSVQFSGAGLSAQIMMAVDELARELRKDHRESAVHEAEKALSEGLQEAGEMREQAGDMKTGAIVSGVLTGVSGAAQMGSALAMSGSISQQQASDAGALESFKASNSRLELFARGASTTGQIGGAIREGYEASGKNHEANAREHAARAQAASRRAEAEQGGAQDAQKSSDKARDLHQQIIALDHASRMAVLKG